MSKAKKVFKIIGIVLGAIAALLLVFYAVLWIIRATKYDEAIEHREKVLKIPELGSGYVPQGLGYSAEKDMYVLSGYDGDDTVLFTVKDGKATRAITQDQNGETLKGHAGGVSVAKDFVYIANGSSLDIFSLDEIVEANGGSPVKAIGKFPVCNSASYVFTDENNLYVGEFYRAGNYETDKAHYYTSAAGDENKAIVSVFELDSDGSIKKELPDYAISVTGLVQGFATTGDSFILSRSYGLADSKLEYYGKPFDTETEVTVKFKDSDDPEKEYKIPLYCLDSSVKKKTLVLPSFAEDLVIVKNRVCVNTEAACNKYVIGKLFGANKVYSYPVAF